MVTLATTTTTIGNLSNDQDGGAVRVNNGESNEQAPQQHSRRVGKFCEDEAEGDVEWPSAGDVRVGLHTSDDVWCVVVGGGDVVVVGCGGRVEWRRGNNKVPKSKSVFFVTKVLDNKINHNSLQEIYATNCKQPVALD